MKDLKLYNTLERKLSNFNPIDPKNIKIYACGPTVYDFIHIGNARPLVIFDVLVRVLRNLYPKVTYVRNITDVDDKINQRAKEKKISISELTNLTIKNFHDDCLSLGNLIPEYEPKATDHINEMIEMIEKLIYKGFAYVSSNNVLFSIEKYNKYGELSGRSLDDMISGSRVNIAEYKKNPGDFILWKPSSDDLPGWDSPWGRGRPGWHIECSAMSKKYLGDHFDIHAGGSDLIFPHHENEIAQSCCANNSNLMANYWLHNGYVTSNGEKMSKSLGNFTTINNLLLNSDGESIRYSLLQAHYRAPLSFGNRTVNEANKSLSRLYRAVDGFDVDGESDKEILKNLSDDLSTPKALARAHFLADQANKGSKECAQKLKNSSLILGILSNSSENWFKYGNSNLINKNVSSINDEEINKLILERKIAKENKDFIKADQIRDVLLKSNIILEDKLGMTNWRKS
ncbi:MAG: cysteine--tRNA ligase [Candidatus Puniceispirillales bacterium]|tara:strand:- start:96 stop:1466 length:1371 start_codon:yes stop_codon:yes gene_type:complete